MVEWELCAHVSVYTLRIYVIWHGLFCILQLKKALLWPKCFALHDNCTLLLSLRDPSLYTYLSLWHCPHCGSYPLMLIYTFQVLVCYAIDRLECL